MTRSMTAGRRIELFSGLRIIDDERVITHFLTQKTAALLAFLAYYRDRAHLRENLIEMLWPYAPPAAGRQSLSSSLSLLRHQLEPVGVTPGSILLADRNTVQLNPDTTTTDVAEFECALSAAERAPNWALRAQRLEQGILLYQGALLSGLFEPWIAPEADRLSVRFARAVLELVEMLIVRGDTASGVSLLERAVAVEPRQEELGRRLTRLRAAQGGPAVVPRAAPGIGSPSLPVGTVSVLAIDIRDGHGESEQMLLPLRAEFQRHGGVEMPTPPGSQSHLVAFRRTADAVSCAAVCQLQVARRAAPDGTPPPAPAMAIHTTDLAVGPDGTYRGEALSHALGLLAGAQPAQILCSETTAEIVRHSLSGGFHLRELRAPHRCGADPHGPYALGDARSEPAPVARLFELDYLGTHPLAAARPRESPPEDGLPLRLTRFFGRRDEMKRLASILGRETRLVTLVGAPGCGKTRLAIEVARCVREIFAGRVWFVPLADLEPGSDILDRALDALGIVRSTQAAPIEQIASVLADQPALIIFDNCEHLLPGAAAQLLNLRSRVPNLRCLVTSRHRLELAGEQHFIVPPLPTPAASSVDQLLMNESVQLFVDRAQWVQPDFQLTTVNSNAVVQICCLLDGVPLAIEIAAARTAVLSPAQIEARLGQGLELLASREREAGQRHRSMRAALAWSYELLSAPLQHFFAWLSVFRAGWTVDAAEGVCAEPLAVDYLSELVACSLVVAEPASTDELRFRMLELVREYAAEKLVESGLEGAARARHADYFFALAERAEPELIGPEQGLWLDRLTADLKNLIAAVEICARDQAGPDRALRLAAALYRLWWVRGYWALGRSVIESVLRLDTGATPTQARAKALNVNGYLATAQGEMREAEQLLSAAVRLFRELGDYRGLAFALLTLSIAKGSDPKLFLALRKESRAIFRRLGDKHGEGLVVYGLAQFSLGEHDRAAQGLFTQALALVEEDLVYRSGSLGSLGDIAAGRGERDQAEAYLTEALAIARRIKFRSMEGALLGSLAELAYAAGDITLAVERARQGLDIHRELGAEREIAGDLMALHEYAVAMKAGNGAHSTLLEWLTHVARIKSPHLGAHALEAVARLLMGECPAPADRREETMTRCVQFLAYATKIFATTPCEDRPSDTGRLVAELRMALGEDAFATAWERGQALPQDRAMADALAEVSAVG